MIHDDLSEVSLARLLAADNWQSKYRLITDWGRLITPKPALRHPSNAVKGCETAAWMGHEYRDGRHHFAFDSDSRVIKGLAALLLVHIDNKTAEELAQLHLGGLLRDAGLEKHITPSRNNGFRAMLLRACEMAGIDAGLV